MSNLTVTELETLDQVTSIGDEWNQLVENRPMRSTIWLQRWWEQFSQSRPDQLRVLIVRSGNTLVGLAPFYTKRTAGRVVLRLLGDSGNVCTDHTACFAKPGFENEVGIMVAQHLIDSGDWSRLQLETTCVEHPVMKVVFNELGQRGYLVHRKPTVNCWSITIPTDWEAYLETLSKSHRKRCRRLVRSYFESDRVQIYSAAEDNFDDVWKTFLDLHAMRWGQDEKPDGLFSNRKLLQFHEQVARELLDRGQLRLCYLTCDGQPMSAEYQFFDDDTLYGYQSGMSPELLDHQPGNLSLIASIQFCVEHQLSTFDLLRGDEPYKAHWRATPSARYDLRIWPNNISGQIELGFAGARQWAAGAVGYLRQP